MHLNGLLDVRISRFALFGLPTTTSHLTAIDSDSYFNFMGTVKSPITDSSPSPSSFFFSPFQLIEDVARAISVTWHTGLEGLDRIPSSTMSVSGVYRTINQISAPSFQKSLWLTALITVQNMLRRSALRGAHARGFSSEARY